MDKATRAHLLRRRFYALKPAKQTPGTGKRAHVSRRPDKVNQTCNWRGKLGPQTVFGHNEWVMQADAPPPQKPLGHTNKRETSALTKIAAKWRRFT